MEVKLIGITGLILIVISWIPQIIKITKSKKSDLSVSFGAIYVLGSLALVFYAYQVKDNIFLILNSLTLLMGLLALFYTIRYKK